MTNEKEEVKGLSEEEALNILKEAEAKKNQAFIDDYTKLCEKHGRQISATASLNVVPYSEQKKDV